MSAATWVIDSLPVAAVSSATARSLRSSVRPDEDQRRAAPGELLGCCVAEPRRGAGDDDDPTGEVVVVERRPVGQPAAGLVAEAGEARDDRCLDQRVDDARDRSCGGRCGDAFAGERLDQPRRGAVADPVERQPEQRIGQAEQALQLQLCVVRDDRAVAVGHDGDRVLRGQHAFSAKAVIVVVAVVVRDGVVAQRHRADGQLDGDVERRARAGAVALDLLHPVDAGIPLGEVREIGHVGERLGGWHRGADMYDVTGHAPWSTESGVEYSARADGHTGRRSGQVAAAHGPGAGARFVVERTCHRVLVGRRGVGRVDADECRVVPSGDAVPGRLHELVGAAVAAAAAGDRVVAARLAVAQCRPLLGARARRRLVRHSIGAEGSGLQEIEMEEAGDGVVPAVHLHVQHLLERGHPQALLVPGVRVGEERMDVERRLVDGRVGRRRPPSR